MSTRRRRIIVRMMRRSSGVSTAPDLPFTRASGRAHQSFGMRIVLLIISEPESAQSRVSG